jgi:hypothetical protein
MAYNKIRTFGEAREVIVETIMALKSGEMDISRGMAIAANMKVLNDNICAEINAAKLSIQAQAIGKDFGEVLRLGTRTFCDDQTPMLEQK